MTCDAGGRGAFGSGVAAVVPVDGLDCASLAGGIVWGVCAVPAITNEQ